MSKNAIESILNGRGLVRPSPENAFRERALWSLAAALAMGAGGCQKSTSVTFENNGDSVQPLEPGELPVCEDEDPPGLPNSGMAPLGLVEGTCFWIDRTEVSRGDYRQFLSATDKREYQHESCGDNSSFDNPECSEEAADGSVVIQSNDEHPIVCVDWCDAAAYCAWAGKSLCAGEWGRETDPKVSEFYSACSSGDRETVPAASQDIGVCNTDEEPETGCNAGACSTRPVGSGDCVTNEGVYDLAGNVAEWTGECSGTSATSECAVRGGSMGDSPETCKSSGRAYSRGRASPNLGFRCCAR